MGNAAEAQQEPTLDHLIEGLNSDDFKGPEPTEKLSEAIRVHGGSFRQAVSEIRQRYDAMIKGAGQATFEEQQRFLKANGLGDPMLRRRVENSARARVQAETADGIVPPLKLIIADLVREEQARRDAIAEKEAAREAAEKAEADRLAEWMKRPHHEALCFAFADLIFAAQQKEREASQVVADAQRKLQEVKNSGAQPPKERVWSDGSAIHPRDEGVESRTVAGAVITQVERHPPWPELEKAQREAQAAGRAQSEAATLSGAAQRLGVVIVQWPDSPVHSTDVLQARLARIFGQNWERGQGDGISTPPITVTSAPKAKRGGLLK